MQRDGSISVRGVFQKKQMAEALTKNYGAWQKISIPVPAKQVSANRFGDVYYLGTDNNVYMIEKSTSSDAPFVNSKTNRVEGFSNIRSLSVGSNDEIWAVSNSNLVSRRLAKHVVGTNAPTKANSISANDKRVAFVSTNSNAYVYQVNNPWSTTWNDAGVSRVAHVATCSNGNLFIATQDGKNKYSLLYGKAGSFEKVTNLTYRFASISCD